MTEWNALHHPLAQVYLKILASLLALAPIAAMAGDTARGRDLVLGRWEGSCLLCHAIPGADRPAGNIGPSLAEVGARLSPEEIRSRIVDPVKFNPGTVMPSYGRTVGLWSVAARYRGKPLLSDREIDDAVAFLVTLR